MIRKETDEIYLLVALRARCGIEFSRLITREDIPRIKNINLMLRFRRDYKRKENRL